MDILIIISTIIGAYLLGSIPSAVWIGKRFYNTDIREHGSRNAGATNMLRVLGRRAALPVFVLDALKGYAAVMLSYLTSIEVDSEPFIYLRIVLIVAVILGHVFPIFAGFKGGKGVATVSGCMLAMAPIPLACSFAVFLLVFFISKYVSLGSIISGISFPLFVYLKFLFFNERISPTLLLFAGIVATLLLITHRNNFKRLRKGTEPKTLLTKKRDVKKP